MSSSAVLTEKTSGDSTGSSLRNYARCKKNLRGAITYKKTKKMGKIVPPPPSWPLMLFTEAGPGRVKLWTFPTISGHFELGGLPLTNSFQWPIISNRRGISSLG